MYAAGFSKNVFRQVRRQAVVAANRAHARAAAAVRNGERFVQVQVANISANFWPDW
jgi:hypothetical protein